MKFSIGSPIVCLYFWSTTRLSFGEIFVFDLYIKDLCDYNFRVLMTAFADDITLFYDGNSFLELQYNMQSELDLLRIWFDTTYMILNIITKYVIFKWKTKVNFETSLIYHTNICNRCEI